MGAQGFHRAWLDAALTGRDVLLIAARGHAKSEYFSAVLPAWLIGHDPARRIVHITSTDALATMYARRLQGVIESWAYRRVFPDLPGRGRKWTENEWTLDIPGQRDPTWRCAGRGGAITGGRADVIIVDDVVTLENARGAGERERTLEWFQQTLVPMLVPGTGQLLVIGTRYHEEDLYASLMAGGLEALIYPAEDACGEILWPERFTRAALDARRRPPLGSPGSYASQYLCRPLAATGEVFRRAWFPRVGDAPELRDLWWSWDTAVSASAGADFTAGVLGGLGVDGHVYLLAVTRGQWEPYQAKARIIAAWEDSRARWGARVRGMLCEDTKDGRVLAAWLRESAGQIPVLPTSPAGDGKATRAAVILPYCEAGRVRLVTPASPTPPLPGVDPGWADTLLAELVSFTRDGRHAHDDQLDALVYLLSRLFGLAPPTRTGTRLLSLGRR